MLEDQRSTPLPAVTINCLLSKDGELQNVHVGAALASNIARFKVTRRSFFLCRLLATY